MAGPLAKEVMKQQGTVVSDDSQTPTFLEEVNKEILEEAPTDAFRRPTAGDFVTAEVSAAGEDGCHVWRSWNVGAGPPWVTAGVDLDRAVRTMRCGEQCLLKQRGEEVPVAVTMRLVGHERSEDLLHDARLVRTTVAEGTGWHVPRVGTELKVRFAWRTALPEASLPQSTSNGDATASKECAIVLGGSTEASTVDCRDISDLRRQLFRAFGVPVLTRLDEQNSEPSSGPVLRVLHGDTELVNGGTEGMPAAKAISLLQASSALPGRGTSSPSAHREAREVAMRLEATGSAASSPASPSSDLGVILCSAEDWIPGIAGRLAIADLRVGQRCIVHISPDLAFGAAGLPDFGVPPEAKLEYDIELLKIMTMEDVSLDKTRTAMKKITREGEGYERPVEGTEVTVRLEVHDDASGAVLVEEQKLAFQVACGQYCSVLEETILTMKKGEACEVRCTDDKLYRDQELGLKPGQAVAVLFCIEILDFHKIDLYGAMDDALRVAHSAKRKEIGARFFKEGNWQRALKRYQHVTSNLGYLDHWKDAAAKAEAVSLRRLCNLNAAACHIKLEAWREAEKCCAAVLREQPDNIKALFRRGHALKELADYQEAEQSLRKVLELDKENKEARTMLVKLKQFVKTEVAQQKQMFSRMMAGAGSPTAGTNGSSAASEAATPTTAAQKKAAAEDDIELDDITLCPTGVWAWGIGGLLAATALGLYLSRSVRSK